MFGITKLSIAALVAVISCSATAYAKDLLTAVDRIDGLKMDFLPSYDGRYIYFSHYDSTGNAKELVIYDLNTRQSVATVKNLKTGTIRFHSSTDQYVVLSDTDSQQVVVYDYVQKKDVLRANTKGRATGAWIIGNRLFAVTASNRFHPTQGEGIAYIFDLKTGIKETEKPVVPSVEATYWQDVIFVIRHDIHLYDRQFNSLGKIDIPFKYRFNSSCDRGQAVIHQDHLLVPANCGEIYDIDLPSRKISHVFDYMTDCMFPSVSVANDMMVVASRSGDNTNCELKFIRYSDKSILATIPKKPSVAYIQDNKLILGYHTQWSSPSPIETYRVSPEILDPSRFYEGALRKAHERALEIFHRDRDVYEVLTGLERNNVRKLLADKSLTNPEFRIAVLNDYGFFLSETFDRYREAQAVLENVTSEAPQRYVAHLNLADLYWKIYLFEGDTTFLSKAMSSYEQYLSVLHRTAPTKHAAKRKFVPRVSRFDRERHLRTLQAGWEMGPATVVFAGEEIYIPSYPPSVTVLSRNSLDVIGSLSIGTHDDQFQDNITGIAVCKGKIYVTTTYRYEDSSRASLYVYDRRTLGSIEAHSGYGQGLGDAFCIDNRLFIRVVEDNYEEWDQTTLKPTGFRLENELGIWKSMSGADALPLIRHLIKREHRAIKGRYETNAGSFLLTTNIPPYPPNSFNVYDLESDLRLEQARIQEGRRLIGFVPLSTQRFATVELARAYRSITIYEMSSGKRRALFQSAEIGPLTYYKQFLILAVGRNLMFYDMKREEFVEILKNVTGSGHKGLGTVDYQRITSLNIDRDRLFIWTHLAQYAKVLDLMPLVSRELH